jgi:hypothetical protein
MIKKNPPNTSVLYLLISLVINVLYNIQPMNKADMIGGPKTPITKELIVYQI